MTCSYGPPSQWNVLADECYQQAKDEGCNVAVIWRDADSSLKNSVDAIFGKEPQGVYKCGGHVGRVG